MVTGFRYAAIFMLAAGMLACSSQEQATHRFHALDISAVSWGSGFELTDHKGVHRSPADFRGKAVLLFFGFTECEDHCPTVLAEMAVLMKHLGADGARVQGIFVTLDPERDTPERLAAYLSAFHPSFIALRGTPEEIARAATEFKVFYRAVEKEGARDGDYTIEHSDAMFVLDPRGKLRLYVSPNERTIEKMAEDIRYLLAAG